ncbi:hypothetical protein B566_EDAN007594 [Ephemera danica]|nr:hypothetical protein B566_EDAN007594 [Ephemera danica]
MLWMLMMLNAVLPLPGGTCDVISVTWERVTGPDDLPSISHFWTSTGLSSQQYTILPPHAKKISKMSSFYNSPLGTANSLLDSDERINLALLGSLPHGALTHVRVHWLLDLVSARIEDEKIYYDFSKLDTFLDWLHKFNLYPGFEIMGNPSGVFSNLNDAKEQRWWQQLIQNIVQRYIGRYGIKNITHWRFETWNEPDLKMYNTLNFTLNSFRAYFWSSVNGITTASNGTLKIGGPAGLFRIPRKHHPLCWGLLDSIVQEQQADTLAFISFHRKGNASSNLILQGTQKLIRLFRHRYPTLKHLSVANE